VCLHRGRPSIKERRAFVSTMRVNANPALS
jgi:hypothetical protein